MQNFGLFSFEIPLIIPIHKSFLPSEEVNSNEENSFNRSLMFSAAQNEFKKGFLKDDEENLLNPPKPEKQHENLNFNEAFIVKNIDTGETYNLADPSSISHPLSPNQKIKDSFLHPWKSFWRERKTKMLKILDCVELGDLKTLKSILLESKGLTLDLNTKFLDDWTVLHMACSEGHDEIAAFFLTKEIDVNARTSINRTALHLAAMQGHEKIVAMLIEKGAEINAIDDDFYTPLHYAAERGGIECILELLKMGASPNVKTQEGILPIDLCISPNARLFFKEFHQNLGDNFRRTSIGNVVRNNSRADYVKRFIASKKEFKNKSTFSQISVEQHNKLTPDMFKFYKLLGKGSFGEVYLVREKGAGTLYAMKILDKRLIKSKNLTKYVTSERNVLNFINHPFMVKLSYAFQTEDNLFLVMEFCSGGDLERQLGFKKYFSEEDAKFYIAEIILALESLHQSNIIYRDLKPANVVLDSNGHVKLTDFGLSKQGIENNLTHSFCGSVAYLAPEILLKQGHNRTVDWYLVGMLAYELMVGTPPYYCKNKPQLFENIKNAPLMVPKWISKEARKFIGNCLQRDPSKRLGAVGDAREVKSHEWFQGLDWGKVYRKEMKPPQFKEIYYDIGSPLRIDFKGNRLLEKIAGESTYFENWTVVRENDADKSP